MSEKGEKVLVEMIKAIGKLPKCHRCGKGELVPVYKERYYESGSSVDLEWKCIDCGHSVRAF